MNCSKIGIDIYRNKYNLTHNNIHNKIEQNKGLYNRI